MYLMVVLAPNKSTSACCRGVYVFILGVSELLQEIVSIPPEGMVLEVIHSAARTAILGKSLGKS